ncbi:MAG TPA: methionyl-tRNA formyltransferase, partial [Candidatus Paceibacterota bacterium]
MENPLFAFFGTSVDSKFALEALEQHGLEPAVVVDTKEPLSDEVLNTEWDFFLVASYGKIFKKEILDLPKFGCLNIHPSLLPKYRGPSPYVSVILDDNRTTGVSIMLLEEKMDTGPILAQARIEIDEADWPPKGMLLSEMLFTEGVNLLAEILPDYLSGKLEPTPQDESLATYTRKFTDTDALLDLTKEREAFL